LEQVIKNFKVITNLERNNVVKVFEAVCKDLEDTDKEIISQIIELPFLYGEELQKTLVALSDKKISEFEKLSEIMALKSEGEKNTCKCKYKK
jgi:allophanate hydrolase subunit 1